LQFAQANAQPKIAKEYVFTNADRRPKKNTERTTAVLRNGGCSSKLKVSFSNQLLWWVGSEVLQNPPLRKASKRCKQAEKT